VRLLSLQAFPKKPLGALVPPQCFPLLGLLGTLRQERRWPPVAGTDRTNDGHFPEARRAV